jgi:O-antigen/teichoic acid export membrane protein
MDNTQIQNIRYDTEGAMKIAVIITIISTILITFFGDKIAPNLFDKDNSKQFASNSILIIFIIATISYFISLYALPLLPPLEG